MIRVGDRDGCAGHGRDFGLVGVLGNAPACAVVTFGNRVRAAGFKQATVLQLEFPAFLYSFKAPRRASSLVARPVEKS